MTTTNTSPTTPGTPTTTVRERDFTMERIFDAPRQLLFSMWSDPKHLAHWWGPKGWTLPVCKMDFRPAGLWIYCMRGPDGTEGWGRALYREIVEPERIVYTDSFADEHGEALEGMPQMLITVEFIDLGKMTKLKITATFATSDELQKTLGFGMTEGLTESFDRLDEYLLDEYLLTKGSTMSANSTTQNSKSTLTLPSEREIRMSRVFDAPRELVFKALTDPKLIPQWWGQNSATTIVDKLDVRVGGAWRFIQRNADGGEDAFRGEFREITPPERVVQTFEWEGLPGHIVTDTMTLEDLGGKTRVTTTSLFDTSEDRDGMLSMGMEGGANESWDRLAALLATRQA